MPRHEIVQALDVLENHGLLLRRDDRLGIAPDTLGDHLLENACLNSHGEPTGYADALFDAFRGVDLPSLLNNLAELDWRLSQRNAPIRVLDGIWIVIESDFQNGDAVARCTILDALQGAAVFQPHRTLGIVRLAMETNARAGWILEYWEKTQRDVLEKVPRILEALAYQSQHTEEAIRRLFRIAKQYCSGSRGDNPATVLERLASYQMYKPVEFLSRIADIAASLRTEPDAFEGATTPLDMIDALLQREVRHEEFHEWELRIGSLELDYPTVEPVRKKALAALMTSLQAANPHETRAAVRSLSSVLDSFSPLVGRPLSDAERMIVVDAFLRRVQSPDTPMPLLRLIKNALRQHRPQHHSHAFNQRLSEVERAIPDSEALSSFDAFCTQPHEWRWPTTAKLDYIRSAELQVESAIERFRSAHRTLEEQLQALEQMADDAVQYRIETDHSAYDFLEVLFRDEYFSQAFVRYVLGTPHPRLAFQIRVLLPKLRASDLSEYERIGLAGAAHASLELAIWVAHGVCFGRALDLPLPEDGNIIAALIRQSDPNVRRIAVEGTARMGHDSNFAAMAASLISGVEIAGDRRLADAVTEAFGDGEIRVHLLSPPQVRSLLDQFVSIKRFDQQSYEPFLVRVGEHQPELLLDFFVRRLKHHRQQRPAAGYSPWSAEPQKYFAKAAPPSGMEGQFRSLRDLLLEKSLPSSWIAELYWVFGAGDGAPDRVIAEWLQSGDPEKIRLAEYLLKMPESTQKNSSATDCSA